MLQGPNERVYALDAAKDRFASTVMALGAPDFGRKLLETTNARTQATHLAVISFSESCVPENLVVNSVSSENLAIQMANEYIRNYYENDPNFDRIKNVNSNKISTIRRDYSCYKNKNYWKYFFEPQDIIDKFTIISKSSHLIVSTSFYKTGQYGFFNDREIRRLCGMSKWINALVARHCQLIRGSENRIAHEEDGFPATFAGRLTPRERQVCTGILEGRTSEAIAISLGIRASSVLTHRKNIYRKLNISSQAQLFRMAYDKQAPVPRLNA